MTVSTENLTPVSPQIGGFAACALKCRMRLRFVAAEVLRRTPGFQAIEGAEQYMTCAGPQLRRLNPR
jgi:hypothetical protein